MPSTNQPIPRNLKHLKYVSFLKSTFDEALEGKIGKVLLPWFKTLKNVQVLNAHYSIKTLILANKYFSDLKSYSLKSAHAKILQSLKTMRKTETLKISSLIKGTEVCQEGKNLRRIAMKKMVLDLSETNLGEMMKIAKLMPKSTRLHFNLSALSSERHVNPYQAKLTERVDGIRLKQLSNSSLNSITQSTEYFMKSLTHLHLGKYSPGNARIGVGKLNLETTSIFFSKLGEFSKLRSLQMDLNLVLFYTTCGTIEILKLLTLPVGLETLSLGFEEILTKGRSALVGEDFHQIFDQIRKMKELKALKFHFYMHHFCQKLWEDFVRLFPQCLPKLEILSAEVRAFDLEVLIIPENVFEWVHSHPMLRSVRLDMPLLNLFGLDCQKAFDFRIKSLESLYINIAHRKTEMRESFEGLVRFLADHEGLKRLTLRVFKSDDFPKTLVILNKYLGAMENLKDLRLELVISDGTELEKISCLKPLMKKIKSFSLVIEKRNPNDGNQYYKLLKRLFADEIKNKRKGLEIGFNHMLVQ